MKHVSFKLGGFTLVEMLVVITIITILAGLTLSMVEFATTKGARDRAKVEVQALSVAIESYKVDNGEYPRDSLSTDTINAQSSPAPVLAVTNNTVPTLSGSASLILYSGLSGDTGLLGTTGTDAATGAKLKVYYPFKANMLFPKVPAGIARTATTKIQAIVDPFRNVYGYSTIGIATIETTGTQNGGYNPTFDLWSTADKAQTNATLPSSWITNWN